MFISLSKTLARFGKFRVGFGMRVTKSNAAIMAIVICFAYIIQAMWYLCIVCGWLVYIMMYWLYRMCRLSFKPLKNQINKAETKKEG